MTKDWMWGYTFELCMRITHVKSAKMNGVACNMNRNGKTYVVHIVLYIMHIEREMFL